MDMGKGSVKDLQSQDIDALENTRSNKRGTQFILQWTRNLKSAKLGVDTTLKTKKSLSLIGSSLHNQVAINKFSSFQSVTVQNSVDRDNLSLVFHIPTGHAPLKVCKKLLKKHKLPDSFHYPVKHVKVIDDVNETLDTAIDCESFRTQRQYIMTPLNNEEAEFPIAFSISMYKDVDQVERLLRSIYRPQNYYCIHVDAKSSSNIYMSMENIAGCFDNIFMASERVNVQWGKMSLLESELVCLKDLLKYRKWKYLLNIAGQEWPLKTNWELVQILKSYNGANDIETAFDL